MRISRANCPVFLFLLPLKEEFLESFASQNESNAAVNMSLCRRLFVPPIDVVSLFYLPVLILLPRSDKQAKGGKEGCWMDVYKNEANKKWEEAMEENRSCCCRRIFFVFL